MVFEKSKTNMYGGKQYPPIDVTNDFLMCVEEGRPLPLDFSIRIKRTKEEIKKLKELKKSSNKPDFKKFKQKHSSNGTPKRLVFHMENKDKKKDFVTTHNIVCLKEDVSDIVSTYSSKYKTRVTKIYFNGKIFKV